VTLVKSVELGRARHHYAGTPDELEIRFFAASIAESELAPSAFEAIAWALPKELGSYDFLAANRRTHRAIGHGTHQAPRKSSKAHKNSLRATNSLLLN